GDEEHLRIVARYFGVRDRHELANVHLRRTQRGAFVQRLAHRHEYACRKSFAGDIADQKKETVFREAEEIVKITAGLTRGHHDRTKLDAIIPGKEVVARQRRGLDAMRGVELARDASALLALLLHNALELTLLPGRLGERQHEEAAEEEDERQ